MDYKTINVDEKDMIGRITLNVPPLNILNIEMMNEINKALKDFQGKNLYYFQVRTKSIEKNCRMLKEV